MHTCTEGRRIKTATLTMRKATGRDPLDYLVFIFDNVLVSSYSIAGTDGGGGVQEIPTENVTLNYTQVRVEYQTQNDSGLGVKVGNYNGVVNRNY
jgi:type VI secretion system secreted protein Hcp